MKTLRIKKILVPVDFSELSTQAIPAAGTLARQFGAEVELIHVHQMISPPLLTAPTSFPEWPIGIFEFPQKELAARLRNFAAKFQIPASRCHVYEGAPAFEEICRGARELAADLIVATTHGYTGVKHALLGSTAERLVQHSPCPVFVARPRAAMQNILVPVDFSGPSLEALDYAIGFAKRVRAKIIVFNAVHPGYAFTNEGYPMYDPSILIDAAEKEAKREMRDFVRLLNFGTVPFEVAFRIGPAADEICAFAIEEDLDLIITATHGRTGFKHMLIGSTAENIVRYAQRPVLVVPSHPLERRAGLAERPRRVEIPSRLRRRAQPVSTTVRRFDLTKRVRKISAKPFPERRKTNKFRETHPHK